MKKYSFILEFLKSGPFILVFILIILVLLGILMSGKGHQSVQLKENVIYVVPKSKN